MEKDAKGVKITKKIYEMIERGIAREGGQSNFARRLGVSPMNISRWHHHGINNKGGRYIAWTIFPVLREYLLQNKEIAADDSQYYTHTQRIVAKVSNDAQQELTLTTEEAQLLKKYREMEATMQQAILKMLDAMSKEEK